MILRPLICLAAALALSGCANPANPKTGRFVVTARTTPFYKYGPAQSFGPDFVLNRGQGMTLLEHSFGYSRVQTDDGFSGYVPAEDIAPAPPLPAPVQVKAKPKRGRADDGYFTGPVRKSVPVEKVEGAPALFDVFDGPMPSDPPELAPKKTAPPIPAGPAAPSPEPKTE